MKLKKNDISVSEMLKIVDQFPNELKTNDIWKQKYKTYFSKDDNFQRMVRKLSTMRSTAKQLYEFEVKQGFDRYLKIMADKILPDSDTFYYDEFMKLYKLLPHI